MATSSRLGQLKRDLEVLAPKDPSAPSPNPRDTSSQRAADAGRKTGNAKPESDRGRGATTPTEIPTPGWKDILVRTWSEVNNNNIFLAAGGVTYAVLVALFPALAALVSIYGLFFDPAQVEQQVNSLSTLLPAETTQLLSSELHSLTSASTGTLGISAIVSLLLALWSASRGMSGLINALNIAYQQAETRGFFKLNAIAIGLTFGALIGGTIVIALVGVLPAAIQFVGLGSIAKWVVLTLEWPLLISVVLFGLAATYRFAPNREKPQWRWVSPGAIGATVLWLLGSVLFSVYVSHFNSYGKTYGSLGGVVILLTWLWLSSFVALLGAVINAQSERQTTADSTVRQGKPLGQRDAFAADTVGERTG